MTAPPLVSQLPVHECYTAEYFELARLLPISSVDGVMIVAAAGEPDADALDDLQLFFNVTVEFQQVSDVELDDAIRRTFAAQESVIELVRDLDSQEAGANLDFDAPLADVRDLASQPPVIRFVNLLIREGHDASASDIHLEATREGLRARMRVDGVLSDLPTPPASLQAAIISRIKLLAELDIAERRVPQDGRIRVRLESHELDIRVSTVPTLVGESVVLRLLDRGGGAISLDQLGMGADVFAEFARLAQQPHGIVLATGPTGSGKTTTLYAALGLRRPDQEKIITVEDPVEYHLGGVTQVPVHTKAGVTFASALRSILRQDPDVLMVGEMRDPETAGIAIQAAMTGHLVFSTLHTNDAVSALSRVKDLGVKPYMVAATLEGVLAQRLVRRICSDCRESYVPEPGVLALLGAIARPGTPLVRGRGCERCRQTGFRGRVGLFELLVLREEIRDDLLAQSAMPVLRERARSLGMVSLMEDGWRKAQAGLTTVEEVLRVVQA
ncbi:MAG TPA: GspE/PulE family protein [Gemmatimonadales bacterium]|nr:GspE/PulE family protein [Gemmatimonadales bacterium]